MASKPGTRLNRLSLVLFSLTSRARLWQGRPIFNRKAIIEAVAPASHGVGR
ncbi:hypothetical protein FLM9_1270 [Candidatus Synechococcus spongiarum]|uniref:Uncharacterized protein n=1 Tax=Candidatus Synechococcus spongiarum TaxID=431041 RepID=A0A161KJW1_9SYNE|nr:hypothetical protein FLM9_1270 [Candidatus Synechococcus spongiarum]